MGYVLQFGKRVHYYYCVIVCTVSQCLCSLWFVSVMFLHFHSVCVSVVFLQFHSICSVLSMVFCVSRVQFLSVCTVYVCFSVFVCLYSFSVFVAYISKLRIYKTFFL